MSASWCKIFLPLIKIPSQYMLCKGEKLEEYLLFRGITEQVKQSYFFFPKWSCPLTGTIWTPNDQ